VVTFEGLRRLRRTHALLALVLAPAAAAGTLTRDAGAGDYGVPYGYLGPRATKVWEVYRKNYDTFSMPYGAINVQDLGADTVLIGPIHQGTAASDAGEAVYQGLLGAGTTPAAASYPQGALSLVGIQSATIEKTIALRLGFAEHNAAGGGAAFNAFISAHGGDTGATMDLFYGSWGVDGVYTFWKFDGSGGTWLVQPVTAELVAATSGEPEFIIPPAGGSPRTNNIGQVTISGATPVAQNYYDTGIPSSGPLQSAWSLAPAGVLTVQFGPMVAQWQLDNRANRRGFTNPGNPDSVAYQNGSLDPAHTVPVFFVHWGAISNVIDAQPAASITLAVDGDAPSLSGPATQVQGQPFGLQVSGLDALGNVDPAYAAQVVFAASDPLATVPAGYTFGAPDHGTRFINGFTLDTLGPQTLTVTDSALPALTASVQVLVLAPDGGMSDGGAGDAGAADAGAGDAGAADAGTPDAGHLADAGTPPDAGAMETDGGVGQPVRLTTGCGCSGFGAGGLLSALLILLRLVGPVRGGRKPC
jgi:hypothetical protein